ncbi:MAG: PIN domain-containing protein [Bifidobacteriaceae bacterium]|jgi:tRNA(fMet)-specific endonuclease VapC|nr:PIN domain-containing protein [Bifidobacteriaceae bacterium]
MLDTNTASYILKGNPPQVRRRLQQAGAGCVAVSVVTEAELRFGAAHQGAPPKLAEVIEQFLALVRVLPWDSAAACAYARLRARTEAEGAALGALDTLIAAAAAAAGAVLVTHDGALLRLPADLLSTEDWTL